MPIPVELLPVLLRTAPVPADGLRPDQVLLGRAVAADALLVSELCEPSADSALPFTGFAGFDRFAEFALTIRR
ncbi:hypothetical protein ACGFSD_23030 [Streptomyces caniferus]|uniref:hypothetical protein n=1 Tax=Streptomyces caniferus TaxID=285557 RepID=UPI0033C6E2D7